MIDPLPHEPLELNVHEGLEEFARAAEPRMLRSEAAHCLQLGLLSDMRAGRITERRLATLDRGGETVLAVIRTPPYRLILSEVLTAHAPPHAGLLEPLLQGLPGDLPGVIGPVELVSAFVEAYAARHGVRPELKMGDSLHACHEVELPQGVEGRLVKAEPRHEALLVEWWRAFQREAVPYEPDRAEQSVARDLNATVGGLWLWEVGGEPVSFAGARGPTPNGIRVGPVYTPPERRRNGYAGALVGSLTRLLLGQGRRFVFLSTDLANPTANALYARLGYRPVADRSVYDFTP